MVKLQPQLGNIIKVNIPLPARPGPKLVEGRRRVARGILKEKEHLNFNIPL